MGTKMPKVLRNCPSKDVFLIILSWGTIEHSTTNKPTKVNKDPKTHHVEHLKIFITYSQEMFKTAQSSWWRRCTCTQSNQTYAQEAEDQKEDHLNISKCLSLTSYTWFFSSFFKDVFSPSCHSGDFTQVGVLKPQTCQLFAEFWESVTAISKFMQIYLWHLTSEFIWILFVTAWKCENKTCFCSSEIFQTENEEVRLDKFGIHTVQIPTLHIGFFWSLLRFTENWSTTAIQKSYYYFIEDSGTWQLFLSLWGACSAAKAESKTYFAACCSSRVSPSCGYVSVSKTLPFVKHII